jgi:hypothetical protein
MAEYQQLPPDEKVSYGERSTWIQPGIFQLPEDNPRRIAYMEQARERIGGTAPLQSGFNLHADQKLLNIPHGADYFETQVSGLLGILGLQQTKAYRERQFNEEARMFGIDEAFRRDQLREQQRQFGLTFPEQQRQFGETLGQQQRQFDIQAQLNAAQTLSSLRAQGPSSEAELALFRQALGIPTGIPSEVSFEDILGMQQQPAGIAPAGGFAGTRVNLPLGGTLTGSQFARAASSPSGAGRLVSFAKAAGDPTLLERTASALLPTGFRGVGTGL